MGGAGDIILIKKNKTKIFRTYGRTGIFMNLTPNGSKKGRIRRRRIAPTRRIRRDKKRRIKRISEAAMGGAGGQGGFLFHSLCGPVDRKKPLTWAAQV
jgi:hypothetical protein